MHLGFAGGEGLITWAGGVGVAVHRGCGGGALRYIRAPIRRRGWRVGADLAKNVAVVFVLFEFTKDQIGLGRLGD